jgi:hypothetical protein
VRQGFCGIASPFVALALEEAAKHFDEMWGGITPDEVAGIIRGLIKETRDE